MSQKRVVHTKGVFGMTNANIMKRECINRYKGNVKCCVINNFWYKEM